MVVKILYYNFYDFWWGMGAGRLGGMAGSVIQYVSTSKYIISYLAIVLVINSINAVTKY